MTDRKEAEDNIEHWIAALNGRCEQPDDDPRTSRIRQTVLQQQQRCEEEIDDLSLRRGRTRLLAAMKSSSQQNDRRNNQPYARRRLLSLAASVALIAIVSSVFLLNDSTDYIDDGTVKSLDGLETIPNEAAIVTLDSVDVAATADRVSQRLSDAGLSVETRPEDRGTIVLTVVVESEEDVRALASVLVDFGAPAIVLPGTYRIRIQ